MKPTKLYMKKSNTQEQTKKKFQYKLHKKLQKIFKKNPKRLLLILKNVCKSSNNLYINIDMTLILISDLK